ncbi:MAG: hypothetical protein JF615_06880 [Asticcacaulis sp.]|nr:hypothetical protein [Asticcacaulis sp.]
MKPALPVLALAAVLAASGAHAASFDCGKAKTPDEKTICRNRVLSDADVRMATLCEVNTRVVMMGARGDMQDAQKAWLAERHKCGASFKCLVASYDKRTKQLQADFDAIASRGPF